MALAFLNLIVVEHVRLICLKKCNVQYDAKSRIIDEKVIMLVSTMAADETTIVFVSTKPMLTYFTTDGFGLRSILINYPDNK